MASRDVPMLLRPEDMGQLGPKMRVLTPLQQNFVMALIMLGTRDHSAAYRKAGYATNSDGSVRVEAHKLWHDERIQAALEEESRRHLKGLLPLAVERLARVLESTSAADADALKAAGMVMDRAGLHAVSERHTVHETVENNQAMIDRIKLVAQGLGLPVEQLLGARLARQQAPVIIDVTPEPNYEELF